MTGDKDFVRPPSLAGVVPMDFAALDAWRRSRPEPAPGPAARPAAYGPDWELTVNAGGRLDILEPPALELAAVAALGAALRGVAFVDFGLDLLLPAPAGSDPDDPRPPAPEALQASLEPLHRAHSELRRRLDEQLGLELAGPLHLRTGRVRREEDGELMLPGRSGTTVLLGQAENALAEVLELSTWPTAAGESLWAAYGVVLHVGSEFPTRRFPTNPPPGFTGPYHVGPIVDEGYWASVGETLRVAAAGVGLPAWPLLEGSLRDPIARSGQSKNWQLRV